MSTFDVWLWLKLDDMRECLKFVFALFGAIGGGASLVAYLGCRADGSSTKWAKHAMPVVLFGCICGVAHTLTPSTKQAAAIYVVPQLVESRVFTNDIPQLYGMAVDALKEKLAVEVAK